MQNTEGMIPGTKYLIRGDSRSGYNVWKLTWEGDLHTDNTWLAKLETADAARRFVGESTYYLRDYFVWDGPYNG
jgi:hypothetical protein